LQGKIINRRKEKFLECYLADTYDITKEMPIKIRELIIEQHYKSTIQISDLGFRLDNVGYKKRADYDSALEKFEQFQKIHDRYEKELKIFTKNIKLTDKEIIDIKDFVLGLYD